MDFIEGFPRSEGKDIVFVNVEGFSKYAHFLPETHPFNVVKVDKLFMTNV